MSIMHFAQYSDAQLLSKLLTIQNPLFPLEIYTNDANETRAGNNLRND